MEERGFTLIEVMVTVAVLSITGVFLMSSFPLLRSQQRQLLAEQQIQSLIREAQQQSLNGQRSEKCLTAVPDDVNSRKRCSNIGVAFRGNEYYIFADSNGDLNVSESDVKLVEGTLPENTAVQDPLHAVLFVASPPLTTLWFDGNAVLPNAPATLVLRDFDNRRVLRIYSSGVVERESE